MFTSCGGYLMPSKKKVTDAVGRSRRQYADASARARSFVAEFTTNATPQEIATRLFNNQHPKPLEYFLELWREYHVQMPTVIVVEVVRAYDRLLSQRATSSVQ
jgi:hypothetical protein